MLTSLFKFVYDFAYRRKHIRYKLTPGEIFNSLGVLFKEILSFKNCKISGWQKRSYILFKILSFKIRLAQKVFNTSGSYALAE